MKKLPGMILILLVIITAACSESTLSTNGGTDERPTSSVENKTLATDVPKPVEPTLDLTPTLVPGETEPTSASTPPGLRVVAIDANSSINLAIDEQGRVWQWGNYTVAPANSPCKGGDACLLAPALVPNLADVAAVSAGFDHRMALKKDGSLWGWGQNETYQLGLGHGDKEFHAEPVAIPGMTDVVAVSAGANFTLALKKDGTVWAWGINGSGELGDGKDSYTPDYGLREESPFQVVNLGDVVAVDTGWHHAIALRSDGTVWTWGANELGELGLGSADTGQHPVPVQVPGLSDVVKIAAGFSNSLAQTRDGVLWAWGGNLGGQLDPSKIGGLDPFPNPILLQEMASAAGFDASSMQLAALKTDGTVLLTGFGDIGSQTYTPTGQTAMKDIVDVACGEDHLLALDKNGVVWAWGNNNVGQLGDGTIEPSPAPKPVRFGT